MMAVWEMGEVRAWLGEARQRLENPGPFLQEGVAPILRGMVRENLAAGGRPPFPALEPTTVAARRMDTRRRQLPGSRPLAGGPLEESYTQESAPGHIEEIQGNILIFGSEFGAIHEYGGTRPYPIRPRQARALLYVGYNQQGIGWTLRRRVEHPPLPARPVLTLPEETRKQIERTVETYLAGERI